MYIYISNPPRFKKLNKTLFFSLLGGAIERGFCIMRNKKIKDFEHYLIFDNGKVFNTRTGKFKKSHHDHKGYKRIRLIDGRKRGATKKIHRLVAQAFLSDYSETLQVNHKNFIKDDNRVENLEMVTQSQNTKHAWDNGKMKLTKKDKNGRFTK